MYYLYMVTKLILNPRPRPTMSASSKTSVTNFIRDAIANPQGYLRPSDRRMNKAEQCIQDIHIVINTQPQIPVVIVHQFCPSGPVNNYIAIQIQ